MEARRTGGGAALRFIARRDDENIEVDVERFGTGYRVRIADRWIDVDFVNAGGHVRSLRLEDGTQYSLIHHREGNRHEIIVSGTPIYVEVIDPLALKRRRGEDEIGGGGLVKALMPGRVVRILVKKGDSVKKGSGLLILEAMKMENEIQAPLEGVVDEIFVESGQTVESGAELAHIG
jgi:biotin carboxyl carrier protein